MDACTLVQILFILVRMFEQLLTGVKEHLVDRWLWIITLFFVFRGSIR